MRKPIEVNEALAQVLAHTARLESESIALEDAYGRILAEPIIARHDVPPFNRTAYDGYAIRAVDTEKATKESPAEFKVIGEIGAGFVGEKPLGEMEAYRIMTGAILPPKADAVVMLEHTETVDDAHFSVQKPLPVGNCISFQGEDAQEGEVLIEAGEKIHPGTTALLATFGYAQVKVSKRPKVSIISTGTELLDVSAELEEGKIRNSNGPMLQSQLDRMGIPYQSFGMLEDDLDHCTKVVEEALAASDIVITTGGVSVGDYDYLPAIYERLKAKVLYNKIAMRPGSVTTVAVVGEKLLFGLSGNPSACFTGFELFTRPAIFKMMGSSAVYLPAMEVTLGEDFPKTNHFAQFLRGIWKEENGETIAVSAGFNKTNAVSSIGRGNCIIALPPTKTGYHQGDKVTVLLLGQEIGSKVWELSL